jgi:hypothetical protein
MRIELYINDIKIKSWRFSDNISKGCTEQSFKSNSSWIDNKIKDCRMEALTDLLDAAQKDLPVYFILLIKSAPSNWNIPVTELVAFNKQVTGININKILKKSRQHKTI